MLIRTSSLILLVLACGDDDAPADAGRDTGSSDVGVVDTGTDVGADVGTDGGGEDAEADVGPPTLTIRITASGDVFPHDDLLGGQTPRATVAGVRAFSLHRSMSDPAPLVLFRSEGADVPVGYVPGDDTILTTVDASLLEPGSYTFARLVQSYARFEVDATLHRLDGMTEGAVSAFQVIADATEVDGVVYDSGHYDYAFAGGATTQEWTGDDALFPDYSDTPGAIGVVEDGEWAVYFPIELEITEPATVDAMLTLDVNMHESFRWTDLLLLGYQTAIFDVTDISFEPVVRFGGNSFELTASF